MGGKIKTTWQSAINAKRDCFRYASQPLEKTKCLCIYAAVWVCVCNCIYLYEGALAFVFVRQLFSYWWGLIVCRLTMHGLSLSVSLSSLFWPFHFNIILFCEAHKSSLSFLISCWRKIERERERRTHSIALSAWMNFIVASKTHVNWNE